MITQKKISKGTLILLTIAALTGHYFLENSREYNPWYRVKIKAAVMMKSVLESIRGETLARGMIPNVHFDPNETGLIGPPKSVISTAEGNLEAKLMSLNPNLAAVIVDMFKKAGINRGDTVAISLTGSFPGANIAVLSACKALNVHPLIISSVGASSWGATNPKFTWLDIEEFLNKNTELKYSSLAVSLGGAGDIARDLSEDGRDMIREAILRNNKSIVIHEDSLEKSVQRRLQIYDAHAAGKPIRAFINIGGGAVSFGGGSNEDLVPPGLNQALSVENFFKRGLIYRMATRQISIINIIKIRKIANQYGLSDTPITEVKVGQGHVFYKDRYDLKLTILITVSLFIILILFIEGDIHLLPIWSKKIASR